MARVTVEDCVLKVPNRFDLVMLAAQRARDISSGAQLTLERDKDKNPVIALREIAEETVDLSILADSLVKGHQRQIEFDEPEEDEAADFELPQVPGELTGEATAQPEGASEGAEEAAGEETADAEGADGGAEDAPDAEAAETAEAPEAADAPEAPETLEAGAVEDQPE